MKTNIIKERAKGAITIGAVCYAMSKYGKYIANNPAIPLIPRIGIGVVASGCAGIGMIYGTERLIDPELYGFVADEEMTEDNQVTLTVVDGDNSEEEKDA